MKNLTIALLIAASLWGGVAAQNISLVHATRQSWSGGVAGHHGTNYAITLRVDNSDIKLDSFYVNGDGFPIIVGHLDKGNTTSDSVKHTYTIGVGEAYNDIDYARQLTLTHDKTVIKPHRNYSGAGLITYYYKGQKKVFSIKEIEALPSLNYP